MSIYSFRGLCPQTPTLGVSQRLGFKNPNPLQECFFYCTVSRVNAAIRAIDTAT